MMSMAQIRRPLSVFSWFVDGPEHLIDIQIDLKSINLG